MSGKSHHALVPILRHGNVLVTRLIQRFPDIIRYIGRLRCRGTSCQHPRNYDRQYTKYRFAFHRLASLLFQSSRGANLQFTETSGTTGPVVGLDTPPAVIVTWSESP